jgi:hypothetical protein
MKMNGIKDCHYLQSVIFYYIPGIPLQYTNFLKSMIKKGALLLLILLLVITGLNYLLFDVVVPKTASLAIPPKWRMLPLRQSKTIVHAYLGNPVMVTNPTDSTQEEWLAGTKGKMYLLRMDYASDTIAVGYSIRYKYKNRLVERNYLIDSFSIK